MRKSIILAGMLFLACGAVGCGGSADSLLKKQFKYMNEWAEAVEKNDDSRAKEATKNMEETAKKLEALKLSEEEKKKLVKRHQDEFQKANTRVEQAAMNRVKREFDKIGGGGFPEPIPNLARTPVLP